MLKAKKVKILNNVGKSDTIKVIQIKDVCRICLNSDGSQYTDLFSIKFNETTTLPGFIWRLTQIRVIENDEYPQKICTDCICRYTESYNLYQLTKESFDKLKSILSTKCSKKSTEEEFELTPDSDLTVQNAVLFEVNKHAAVTEPAPKKAKITIKPESVDEVVEEKIKPKPKSKVPAQKITKKLNSSNDESIKSSTENIDNNVDAVDFLMAFLNKSSNDDTAVQQNIDYEKRPYLCKICNKRFLKRSNLLDHLRLHANVKNFKCPYCDKSFVQSGNYKAHLRVHTNERPYECTTCGKSYQQSSALKIHMRSHTNEKKYICDKCQKGFTNSSDLSKHKLIHNDVKKFKCETCEKGFSQKVHLTKHLEKGSCSYLGIPTN